MTESGTSRKGWARRLRVPRGMTFAGLLLLCVCFFLPQVKGCTEPVIPAIETYESGPGWLFVWGLPFVFAFAVGLLYGLWYLSREEGGKALLMGLVCACCILILGWGCIQMIMVAGEALNDGNRTGDATVLVLAGLLIVVTIAACTAAARAYAETKGPMCVFILGLASIGYFLYWPLLAEFKTYYGLWLSVTASVLIAAGGLWEALSDPND